MSQLHPAEIRSGVLRLPDGRSLEYLAAGSSGSPALVLHHGTPTSARLYRSWMADAVAAGLAAVAYSRPGYGASARRAGRDVAQAATDTGMLLDHLGHDRFVTAGWSGGGPHALACGALLGERCAAVATLAGVGPFGAEDLDFLDGMGPENVDEFGRALEGEASLTAWMQQNGPPIASVTGPQLREALGGLVEQADAAVLVGEFADTMAESMRWALSGGFAGWIDDDLAFTRPWGFDLGAIEVPVAVWQGAHDKMVPERHGPWLASHIPTATLHFEADHGHLSLVTARRAAILAALAAQAGVSG